MNNQDRFPNIDDKTAREEGDVFAPEFDAHGLIPAIVTCAAHGTVLMFAYMNEEALARSIKTGEAHFWSRSREALWRKGETSGNVLRIVEMRTDCDQDVLWLKVNTAGSGACCHTGRTTCFYRAIPVGENAGQKLVMADNDRRFDPAETYGLKSAAKGTLKSS